MLGPEDITFLDVVMDQDDRMSIWSEIKILS